MAIEPEVLRGDGKKRAKKQQRLTSLEAHISVLTTRKATKAGLISDVAAFDAIIAGIVSEAKRDEINASAVIVRLRGLYVQEISSETTGIAGQRLSISDLSGVVQADNDHTPAEKLEYANAKTNEV